jgi:hypothetical protein
MLSWGAGCSSTVDGDAVLASGLYAFDDGPGDLTAAAGAKVDDIVTGAADGGDEFASLVP